MPRYSRLISSVSSCITELQTTFVIFLIKTGEDCSSPLTFSYNHNKIRQIILLSQKPSKNVNSISHQVAFTRLYFICIYLWGCGNLLRIDGLEQMGGFKKRKHACFYSLRYSFNSVKGNNSATSSFILFLRLFSHYDMLFFNLVTCRSKLARFFKIVEFFSFLIKFTNCGAEWTRGGWKIFTNQ